MGKKLLKTVLLTCLFISFFIHIYLIVLAFHLMAIAVHPSTITGLLGIPLLPVLKGVTLPWAPAAIDFQVIDILFLSTWAVYGLTMAISLIFDRNSRLNIIDIVAGIALVFTPILLCISWFEIKAVAFNLYNITQASAFFTMVVKSLFSFTLFALLTIVQLYTPTAPRPKSSAFPPESLSS